MRLSVGVARRVVVDGSESEFEVRYEVDDAAVERLDDEAVAGILCGLTQAAIGAINEALFDEGDVLPTEPSS